MFKLIKISNSASAAPELVELPRPKHQGLIQGIAYEYAYNQFSGFDFDHTSQGLCVFIPNETVEANDPKPTVKGFFATANMIFECDKCEDAVFEGGIFSNGSYLGLDTEGGVIYNDSCDVQIIDTRDYETTGVFTVRFNV